MERLTKYSNDLIRNKAVNILRKLDSENGLNGDELAIISSFCLIERVENKELKKCEDLEEQGLLLKLPCAVGDIIYEVSYENREFVIKEHIVKEFAYRKYRFPRIEIYCENENGFLVCNIIGKLDECLFLTRPEAEAKLIEMEGKK